MEVKFFRPFFVNVDFSVQNLFVNLQVCKVSEKGTLLRKIGFGTYAVIVFPIIAAIWLLYPTYRAWELEQEREQVAQDSAALAQFEQEYGETLRELKLRRLKLGLDLRGGMYITLEVDVIRLLEESAQRDAIDDVFRTVIQKTREEAERSDEPVLDIFLRYFDQIARPKGRTLFSYFEFGDVRDLTEEDIIDRLEQNIESAVDQAMEIIRQRIDKYGVSEPSIQKQGGRRIVLELPGVTNEKEVRQLLQTTARLEFHLLRQNVEIVQAFAQVDELLRLEQQGKDTASAATPGGGEQDTTAKVVPQDTVTAGTEAADTAKMSDTTNPYAGLSEEEAREAYRRDHPFTSLFVTYYIDRDNNRYVPIDYVRKNFPEGEYYFEILESNIPQFEAILQRPDVIRIIGTDYMIALAAKPRRETEGSPQRVYPFYVLKAEPELTGEVIVDARATFDPTTNSPIVLMTMNADGAERWARITGANVGKRIAIVLDGRVYSAPVVQTRITGGRSQITGLSSIQEARLLEIVLKAGALKAPVKIIEERVVGPSLGEDSIRRGLVASLAALGLVVIFMGVYYSFAGLIADLTLFLNLLLILAMLAAFGGTLTLPGIAGLILTIGMAVDANILIYERAREELYRGRTIRAAIDEGFRKALSAILDSNITTFISGLILFYFGSGPIQGFAVTLMIGIVMTLFTVLVVGRAIFQILLARGAQTIDLGQPKVAAAE